MRRTIPPRGTSESGFPSALDTASRLGHDDDRPRDREVNRTTALLRRVRRAPVAAPLLSLALLVPVLGALGHPVLAYAKSASMTPTLEAGDGFVSNPLDRSPEVGDVVLYEAVLLGGGLAVHRVVGGDARGYVTKGDANPVTDQEAGEPLVTPDRIRGVLVSAGGSPLVLPGVGRPVVEAHALYRRALIATGSPLKLLALASALLGAALLLAPERRPPEPRAPRRTRRPLAALRRRALPRALLARHAALAALIIVVASFWGAARAAHSNVPVSVVVAESPPPDQSRSARPGAAVAREVDVAALPLLPTTAVLEAATPGVRVPDGTVDVPAGGTRRVAVVQTAGGEFGLQSDEVRVWRYPAFLPPEHVLALHRLHPGAPLAALGAGVLAVASAWYAGLRVGRLPLAVLLGGGRA